MQNFSARQTKRLQLLAIVSICFLAMAFCQLPASAQAIYKRQINPHWIGESSSFWYRNDLAEGSSEYVFVDAASGLRRQAFNHDLLAAALTANEVSARSEKLPVSNFAMDASGDVCEFRAGGKLWSYRIAANMLEEITKRQIPASENETANRLPKPRPSRKHGVETSLVFENQTKDSVRIYWLNDQGERIDYGLLSAGESREQHTFSGHIWELVDSAGKSVAVFEATDNPSAAEINGSAVPSPRPPKRRPRNRPRNSNTSPDEKWTAEIQEHNLVLRSNADQTEILLTQDGRPESFFERFEWAPDSTAIVAIRTEPKETLPVYRLESSPKDGGRAILHTAPYALPGDAFSIHSLHVFSLANQKPVPCDAPAIDFDYPELEWEQAGHRFMYRKVDRGHQRFRVIEVDAVTGKSTAVIDEQTDTFLWTTHRERSDFALVTRLASSRELIYATEQSGWRHLYLVNADNPLSLQPITSGEWVVRNIDRIDEENRQIWFQASGLDSDQDPYLLHYCRVNFDGSGFVRLTRANGNHSLQYSPDGSFFIDTYSRVDLPPQHELRRTRDGELVCLLESADSQAWQKANPFPPEVFVAKGRDGKTDIWGVIYRPQNYDRAHRYPVIEDIYAGPHGSFVPKSFSADRRYQALLDLGFVVVKVDGMGTANRSKAFHDVCWHNLKDSGFPDRIAWMQAAAKKDPALDISRVGIFGTSAGGQSAAAAVLHHADFYKAAVASCGCHDNRMDKSSWNEQWMGYPVGPHYAESSNIENAAKLAGKLLLIVGEQDSNVPPESTYRLVDALIKADKDFEFLMIPGMGHSDGGPYGQRRLREFFSRHLLENQDR